MEYEAQEQINTEDSQTRRDFIQSAAAAVGAGLMFSPMISGQQEITETVADINVALIGAGTQGQTLMNACLKIPGIRFKAVCDIWADYNRKRMAGILRAYKHEVNEYEDYKQMLSDEKDIDAVIIATPDFWHADQTVASLEAGLHVYCEKEMSNTIEGARKMLVAAKQTGKLLQIGHQRRSNPRYIHCYEKLIKEFELFGQIVAVNGQWNRSAKEPLGWPQKAPISQATLTKYGYKSMHQFRNWRWYKGLGGGPIVDLGSHQIDVYNWFLEAAPKTVMASGRTNYYDKKANEWYDTVMAIYEYETAQGAATAFYQTITSNSNNGYFEKFMGDQGTLIISEYANRNKIYPESRNIDAGNWLECIQEGHLTAPEEIMKSIGKLTLDDLARIFFVDESPDPPKLDQTSPDEPATVNRPNLNLPIVMDKPIHQPHLENFFDAIRGKTQLNCPAEAGYETAVTVPKVNEAAEAGRRLQFKPEDFMV